MRNFVFVEIFTFSFVFGLNSRFLIMIRNYTNAKSKNPGQKHIVPHDNTRHGCINDIYLATFSFPFFYFISFFLIFHLNLFIHPAHVIQLLHRNFSFFTWTPSKYFRFSFHLFIPASLILKKSVIWSYFLIFFIISHIFKIQSYLWQHFNFHGDIKEIIYNCNSIAMSS